MAPEASLSVSQVVGRGTLHVALTLAVLVAAWQAAITALAIPPFVMPTPLSVLLTVRHDWPQLGASIFHTLQSTVLGLTIALALALALATLLSLSDAVSRTLLPLIITIRTAPVLAIAPLLILLFGRGQATSVAVVVLVSFFPMMVNATRGFTSPKASALELMHVCGASWRQTFLKVRVPFALPYIFTGLRVAATGALLSAMLAEWLSGAPGLGTLILQSGASRDLPLMWAGALSSVGLAAFVYAAAITVERRLAR